MIIVLFGQPHCGKSTLANELTAYDKRFINIDGDKLRDLFANKDYSREGRVKNLNRASDIAIFLNDMGEDVILSLVYPYEEARSYLNTLSSEVKWVYLTYEEIRGREKNHVLDFEEPALDGVLSLNTSKMSINDCIKAIELYVKRT